MSVIDIGNTSTELSSDALMSQINSAVRPGALILFYSDSCGHCNDMKPEWENLKKFSKKNNGKCNIVSINADMRDKLHDSWRRLVKGVPTIIGLREDSDVSQAIPFGDERNVDNFKKFIITNIEPNYLSKGGNIKDKKKCRKNKTKSKKRQSKKRQSKKTMSLHSKKNGSMRKRYRRHKKTVHKRRKY